MPGLRAACPHCAAVFLLTDEQLNTSPNTRDELVRCGTCDKIFNAGLHLVAEEEKEKEKEKEADGESREKLIEPVFSGTGGAEVAGAGESDAVDEYQLEEASLSTDYWSEPVLTPAEQARLETAPQDSEHDAGLTRGNIPKPEEFGALPETPNAGRWDSRQTGTPGQIDMGGVDDYIAPRPNPLVNLLWSLAAFVLLILLGWQVKYLVMEKYAQHENYRSYLAEFCKVAGCELPLLRDSSRFTLTHTEVKLHPYMPGAIRITVKLVNEATFDQPYPDLQLTLTDKNGRIVGRRRFPPGDYLKAEQSDMLGSGELGVVQFGLARPHEKAVGFDIDIVKTAQKSR